MMCYKDMTFCTFHEECNDGSICFRALTKGKIKDACDRKMLISQFIEKPDCFIPMKRF